MSSGNHSHWAKYTTRIITKMVYKSGKARRRIETLQLICDHDGIIFHEVEIKPREGR